VEEGVRQRHEGVERHRAGVGPRVEEPGRGDQQGERKPRPFQQPGDAMAATILPPCPALAA
jgi:hypothetical protein